MKRSHFLEGFLLGAIIGTIGGILFAPNSGSETRKKLRKIKNDWTEHPKEKAENMVAKTMKAIESGLDNIGKMVKKDNSEQRYS